MAPFSLLLSLSLFLFLSVRAEMNSSLKLPSAIALIANNSNQVFPNTSSTSTSNFSYIIPYGKTQDCNIYGPLCQTGSITVGVNLTTATPTTVLPCSSYLSAQSAHLDYENSNGDQSDDFWPNDGYDRPPDLLTWMVSFGQSPECRSYAEAGPGQSTFTDCGASNTVFQDPEVWNSSYNSQLPPAVGRYFSPLYQGSCCGNCSLDIPEVRLYYFPDKTTDCHHNQSSLEKRIHSLIANGSTAVIGANTFTSPSLYVQLMGTATILDRCTTVGPKLIDPIITLAPGELSTWKPPASDWYAQYDNFTAGEVWYDPSGIPGYDDTEGIAPLKIKDLACPTWGLGKSTSINGTVVTTIGPPWLPLIIPPIQIYSLDPIWEAKCTGIFSDSFGLTTFGLFDPPIALTPESLLAPTPPTRPTPTPISIPADPTTVPERATSYAEAAKPVSLPNHPVAPPARTQDPGKESPSQSPTMASADPTSSPQNSAASSKHKGDPTADAPLDPPLDPEVYSISAVAGDAPADPPSNPKVPSVSTVAGDAPADPPSDPKVPLAFAIVGNSPAESIAPSSIAPDPPLDPKIPIVPVPPPGEDPQAQTQGLGAIIYNAFGRSGPEIKASTTSLPPQSILTIGAQTFTVNPTGFKINEAAISPGGTAHTVDGTAISLGRGGILAIGSSTVSLTSLSSMTILAVAGQTFTPNPSAFSIAGTTISADGPAVIINGTIVSLGLYGALEIGSSTISLPTLSETPPNIVYTVADQTFTPNPSAFPIAGTIVSAGGSAVIVDGTTISLDPLGALAIGSSTVDLPSFSDPSPSKVYTVAGQIFTPDPSAFPIANIIISAGGPAATINGTIISLRPSGTLLIGSSTIPLFPTQIPSDINIDGFDINAQPSFVVVNGVTLSAAAAGVTISGTLVSLEAGGATLDIGTGRFALPTGALGAANGSVNVQPFTGGEGRKGTELSFALICGVCGIVLLLTW